MSYELMDKKPFDISLHLKPKLCPIIAHLKFSFSIYLSVQFPPTLFKYTEILNNSLDIIQMPCISNKIFE